MKKAIAFLLGCFMVLGATAVMADTRTDSLGMQAGQQVDDLDSIWMYPQAAAQYGNVADFRLGLVGGANNIRDNWFGVIHKDWDDIGYIGIYSLRPFNDANGALTNSESRVNQFGILSGSLGFYFPNTSWAHLLSPLQTSVRAGNINTGNINTSFTSLGLPFGITDPENKLDLFWAKANGDTTIGVHINYAESNPANGSFKSSDPTILGTTPPNGTTLAETGNNDTSVLGLDLGLGLKNLGAFDSLDLSLGYSLGGLNVKFIQNQQQPAGNIAIINANYSDNNISEIRANILAKSKISDTATGRIYANAAIDSLGVKGTVLVDGNADNNYTDAGETNSQSKTYSSTNFNLGLACDHKVADGKAHVIAALGFAYDDRKWTQTALTNLNGSSTANQLITNSGDTDEETWVTVPLNLSVEAPLFSWLTARVGASHNVYQSVDTKIVHPYNQNAGGTAFQDTRTAEATDVNPQLGGFPGSNGAPYDNFAVDTSFGLSAKMENFTLDMQVSQSALENYLGSFQPGQGIFYGNGPAIFTQADARYQFD